MQRQRFTGPEHRPIGALLAGLFAAVLTALSISHLPQIHFSSWGSLLVGAASGVLLVSLAAFISSLGMNRSRTTSGPMPWRSALKPSVIAMWFTPLILLARQESIGLLPVAGIFVIIAGTLLWPLQKHSEMPAAASSPVADAGLFSLVGSPSWFRQAGVFGAVVCAEAGAMVGASRHLLGGTLLVVLATGAWLYVFREHWRSRSDEFHAPRAFVLVTFATLFTALGLFPFLRRGYVGSSGAGRFAAQSRRGYSQTRAGNPEEGYIAIELWPEHQAETLVAPTPVNKNTGGRKQSSPVVIPFSGVYWFFKAPDISLPPQPREAHGSPEMFDIHSTDRRSVSMQAHQNLGTLVDLSCCRSIRIGIRNGDRYPGTVSIELVLTDTTSPGRPAISLGRKLVRSTRPWMLYDHRSPTTELLEYAVPANPRIRRFDEVVVIFWLDRDRSFAAAKIGIEDFVLVPNRA